MSQESLGLIETIGLTAAIAAADAGVKSANVILVGYELANGDGMTVIKFRGDVGAVTAAVSAAAAEAGRVGRVVSTRVIARPANDLAKIVDSRETVGVEQPAAAVAAAEIPLPVEDEPVSEPLAAPEVTVTKAAEIPVEEVDAAEPELSTIEETALEPEAEVVAEATSTPANQSQSRADRRHRRR
ncbi:BMC domain-containing protein [Aliirhizobium smilacinae]|uniref:BMC domain-containing protein n=1 Tax=Aliirhizobium smilacinae TaxID=1395944 RepID=A0A5C4XEW2_9HYPH|nr:BMC domain-containing protein [Rhizobium smilacinae]TNM60984.1 BMC domain-containing protein [Rhizobium smilacinae]